MHGDHLVSDVDHILIQISVEFFFCFVFNVATVKVHCYLDI